MEQSRFVCQNIKTVTLKRITAAVTRFNSTGRNGSEVPLMPKS